MQLGALRARVTRRLYWAFLISIAIHVAIGAFVLARHRTFHPGAPEEIVSVTTTLAIARRPPPRRVAPKPQPIAAPAPQPQVRQKALIAPAPRHRELARIDSRARVAQPPPALVHAHVSTTIAQQPVDFEKTIVRLREENNPVLTSQRPVQRSDLEKSYAFDYSGSVGTAPRGEGILTPQKSWQADGYDYYYVRYWVEYPDGTTETGIVPWPLRYLPADDPFRLHILHFPLPGPLADFVLPTGTALHPLVAYCYAHRDQLASCPIHHD